MAETVVEAVGVEIEDMTSGDRKSDDPDAYVEAFLGE